MEKYIQLFLFTWLWCKLDPLQELIELLFEKLAINLFFKSMFTILTCWYCLALWTGLIVLGLDNLTEVIAVSFFAWFIEMTIFRK